MKIFEIKDRFKKIVDDYTDALIKSKEEDRIHLLFKMQWLYMDVKDLLSNLTIDDWNSLGHERTQFVISFMQELLALCPKGYAIEHKNDTVHQMLRPNENRNKIGFITQSDEENTNQKSKRRIGFIQDESEYEL